MWNVEFHIPIRMRLCIVHCETPLKKKNKDHKRTSKEKHGNRSRSLVCSRCMVHVLRGTWRMAHGAAMAMMHDGHGASGAWRMVHGAW
jgi:hypothetical protein